MESRGLERSNILLMISFILSLSCLPQGWAAVESPKKDYPKEWWTPVPRKGAPDWEILPQDARRGEVILSKRTELGILSNFAETPFELDGKTYQSLEGFWQMLKYPENDRDPRAVYPGLIWDFTREMVSQMIGFDAKRAGSKASKNMETMGINWVTYQGEQIEYRTSEKGPHYDLILRATRAKLDQNKTVKEILIKTGTLKLRPDHVQGKDTPPAWKYYEIYMDLRAELRAHKLSQITQF